MLQLGKKSLSLLSQRSLHTTKAPKKEKKIKDTVLQREMLRRKKNSKNMGYHKQRGTWLTKQQQQQQQQLYNLLWRTLRSSATGKAPLM